MGQEIHYCAKCQNRVTSADFEKKKAIWTQGRVLCASCVVQLKKAAVERQAAQEPAKPVGRPQAPERFTSRTPRAVTPRRELEALPRRRFSLKPLLVGGVLVVVGILGVLILLIERDETKTDSSGGASGLKDPSHEPKVVEPAPQMDPTAEALEKARNYARENPSDFGGQVERYEAAQEAVKGTAHMGACLRELTQARRGFSEMIERELRPLDEESFGAFNRKDFTRAVEVLEEARERHQGEEWGRAIESRVLEMKRQVNLRVEALFWDAREAALMAAKLGDGEEVQRIRERIAQWGVKEKIEELDRALEGEASTPSEEASGEEKPAAEEKELPVKEDPARKAREAYEAKWREAFALAAARDYEGAAREVERASMKIDDEQLLEEAMADVGFFKEAGEAYREALKKLKEWPRSSKVALKYVDEDGVDQEAEVLVAKWGGDWVEVKDGRESRYVDVVELKGETLVALRGTEEDTSGALMLLVEGQVDAARELSGGKGIPEKYWVEAKARAAAKRRDPAEQDARKIFYSVYLQERSCEEGRRRGGSAKVYRELMEKFGGTEFVKRRGRQLARLLAPAKEYLFFHDGMKGSGTFRLTEDEDLGGIWRVRANVFGADALSNYVDLEFEAQEGMEYRCWVYVGGCCKEVLRLYWQGTELKQKHPQTDEDADAGPGDNLAAPAKHRVLRLSSLHAPHAKEGATWRWAWVELPLPKYATPGPKVVRVLADRAGASLAWGFVSAEAGRPPREAEMKALQREGVEFVAVGPQLGLVGYWSFDEGEGEHAQDSSGKGNHGKLEGGPTWIKEGGGSALSFDGEDDRVAIPQQESLDPAQITVAAWFKAVNLEGRSYLLCMGNSEHVNGHYGLEAHSPETGLGGALNIGGKRRNRKILQGGKGKISAGEWHHGVMTYDGEELNLYLDGEACGSRSVKLPRTPAKAKLTIGGRETGEEGFNGLIDEVRIYERALSASEVELLFEATSRLHPK